MHKSTMVRSKGMSMQHSQVKFWVYKGVWMLMCAKKVLENYRFNATTELCVVLFFFFCVVYRLILLCMPALLSLFFRWASTAICLLPSIVMPLYNHTRITSTPSQHCFSQSRPVLVNIVSMHTCLVFHRQEKKSEMWCRNGVWIALNSHVKKKTWTDCSVT